MYITGKMSIILGKKQKEVIMKKSTKCFLFFTTTTLAGIYAYNKFVASASTRKNLLSVNNGSFFEWRYGNVFYTKQGSGKPILLVHDVNPSSSSFEWTKLIKKLEKDHTVYTLDLLGCGRSDKPNFHYTNYMYVQLITTFVKEVIQEKSDVAASNMSSSFILMADQMDNQLFDKIIFINPVSIKNLQIVEDKKSKFKQAVLNLPLIGTFIYNILYNPIHIDRSFREIYFSKPQLISSKIEDIYYEASHLKDSYGKYLLSSLIGSYMNINIVHAIKSLNHPIYLIGSKGRSNNISIFDEYQKLNPNFESTMLSNGSLYPQLEIPDKVFAVLNNYLNK